MDKTSTADVWVNGSRTLPVMSMGLFSMTRPDPPKFQPDTTQSTDHKQNSDPTGLDQLTMTPISRTLKAHY